MGHSQNTPLASSHSTTATVPTSPTHPDFDFSSVHPPKTPTKPADPDKVKAQVARRSLPELSPIKVPESPQPLYMPRLTTTPGRIAAWKLWLPPPPLSFGKPTNDKFVDPRAKRSRSEDSDDDEMVDDSKWLRLEMQNELATSETARSSNDPATNAVSNVGPLDGTQVIAAGSGNTLIGMTSVTDEPHTVMSTELYREPSFHLAANVTEEKGNAESAGETGGNQSRSLVDGTTARGHTSGPVFIDLTLSDDEDEGNIPPKTGNISLQHAEHRSKDPRTPVFPESFKENAMSLTFSSRDAEIWKVLLERTIARADTMSTSTTAGSLGMAAQYRESSVHQAQPTQHQVLASSTVISQDQNIQSSQHWGGVPVQNNPLGYPFTFRYAVPTQAKPGAPSSGSSRITLPGHECHSPT
ncbi:hypothetical protein FA13DRAFT_1796192 [Coprinellus micaceus]|uniref:Uncharacterized protein n=1 Tax=Coprinellus micaceus TaxID=71717 RepID=A0A4Y7SUY0_COPMI|nr:hypothetical protein FA13DRAFT_1796192 [Coprinellus micaceus]